jgi:hypothetical protein
MARRALGNFIFFSIGQSWIAKHWGRRSKLNVDGTLAFRFLCRWLARVSFCWLRSAWECRPRVQWVKSWSKQIPRGQHRPLAAVKPTMETSGSSSRRQGLRFEPNFHIGLKRRAPLDSGTCHWRRCSDSRMPFLLLIKQGHASSRGGGTPWNDVRQSIIRIIKLQQVPGQRVRWVPSRAMP